MKRTTVGTVAALVGLVAVMVLPAQGATPKTKLVSVHSNGTQGDSGSYNPSVSANGRFVAFRSEASNLVGGDSNDSNDSDDVFVHDRKTKMTERVSVHSNGTEGDGDSYTPAISANGRFVAFESSSTNLVGDDGNHRTDVFVHDRETKKTRRVSVHSNGTEANSDSLTPAISANGRFVAFLSFASNLVGDDGTNDIADVFVHDRETKKTRRVSVHSNGTEGDGHSYTPAISANGRFVAFESRATNLVGVDGNNIYDVFVHDRKTKKTRRVSVRSNGTEGNGYSYDPSISASGRFIAFESSATNLVGDDGNNAYDVFVHDRETKKTKRVSVHSNGSGGDDDSEDPSISASGRFVAFYSDATNVVGGDDNDASDVFMRGPLR